MQGKSNRSALHCVAQEAVLKAAPHPDLTTLNGINVGVGGRQVHPSLIGVDVHRGRPEGAGSEQGRLDICAKGC